MLSLEDIGVVITEADIDVDDDNVDASDDIDDDEMLVMIFS